MCKSCGCHGGKIEKVVIVVSGMKDNDCKSAAEKAIRCLPGVMMAEGDLTLSRLQVDFDPAKTSLEEIEEALATAGYDVMENIASGHYHPGKFHIVGQGVKEYVHKLWMSWT